MTVPILPFPRARRQTYAFLEDARRTCHVYLMTDVDATRLKAARADSDGTLSYVSFVVKAAADVVTKYPDTRAVLRDGLRPKLAVIEEVHAKVLFDKTVDGQRCVVSGIVTSAQSHSVFEIQDTIDTYKNAAVDEYGPFRQLCRIQRLPLPVLRMVYRVLLRNPVRRSALQGTFAVTSIGHEQVRTIFPMISGPLGFGIGHIADAPIVRDDRLTIAPVFTLSLTFDHRVLDGAMASEVLADVKERLESWPTHDYP